MKLWLLLMACRGFPGVCLLWVWTVINCSSNVQIPLRDCKKIAFVEKEKNPFAEWVPFPACSLTNADSCSALKQLGELARKAERCVIDDIIVEALVEAHLNIWLLLSARDRQPSPCRVHRWVSLLCCSEMDLSCDLDWIYVPKCFDFRLFTLKKATW